MPGPFKLNFFFQQGRFGWSETYYVDSNSIENAATFSSQLAVYRAGLVFQPSSLRFLRLSDITIQRDSLVGTVGPPGVGLFNPGTVTSDIANTSLVVRLEGTPLYRRTLNLRGIADEVVDRGVYKPNSPWVALFDSFINRLVATFPAATFGMLVIDKAVPALAILSVAPGVAPLLVTTVANHGYVTNDVVRIRGVAGTVKANGRWSIDVVSATTFTLKGSVAGGTYLGGGTSQKVVKKFQKFTSGKVMTANHRNAGRPFDSPHGRRRRVK